jgi:hypothetical protein
MTELVPFILVYIGIGALVSYGLYRWDYDKYIKWNDKLFLNGVVVQSIVGCIAWPIVMLIEDIRNTCFEGWSYD